MSSPFPGMDPYLEPFWGDVHTRLILYSSDQIHARLPKDLKARVERSIRIDGRGDDDADEHFPKRAAYFPDVTITEHPTLNADPRTAAGGATATLIPLRLRVPNARSRTVRIRTAAGDLVTTIEFLSRSNRKSLAAKHQFRARQQYLLAAGVNIVEVQLLRGRGFPLSVRAEDLSALPASDYKVVIVRGSAPTEADVYTTSIRSPLPTIPIPLRKHEAETYLELQPLIEQAYRNGGYEDIDYRKPPPVDLGPDAAWVEELLQPRRLVG